MTEPTAAGQPASPTAAPAETPAAEVTISEGLSKIFAAGELLTEAQVNEMAEQAKAAAKQSQETRDNKNAQLDSAKK